MAGYSETPLAGKLGLKPGSKICPINAPKSYRTLLAPLPDGVRFGTKIDRSVDLVHLFTSRRADLAKVLAKCRKTLDSSATVWVSWPKKASQLPTDIIEDIVREVALPLGYVDIKVCAVTDIWSGLKLVVRKNLRD